MALHQMVQRFAEIVDRVTWVTPDPPQDDDAVNAVAALYHNKAHGDCSPIHGAHLSALQLMCPKGQHLYMCSCLVCSCPGSRTV